MGPLAIKSAYVEIGLPTPSNVAANPRQHSQSADSCIEAKFNQCERELYNMSRFQLVIHQMESLLAQVSEFSLPWPSGLRPQHLLTLFPVVARKTSTVPMA